jgi:hypothetical protein
MVARAGLEPAAVFGPSSRLAAHFSRIFTTTGHRVSIFSGCPQKCPHPRLAGYESPRTSLDDKTLLSKCFLRIFDKSETSLDIAGGLWSWDGWDSNPGPKP